MMTPALRFYLSFYREVLWRLSAFSIIAILQPLVLILILIIVRYGIDKLIAQGQLLQLLFMLLGIILLYSISGGVNLLMRYLTLRTTDGPLQQFHEEILKRIYSFSRQYYTRMDRKQLHNILVKDMIQADGMINALIGKFVPGLLVSLVIMGILAHMNPLLFLIVMGMFPLLYLINRIIKPRLQRFIREQHRAYEAHNSRTLFALEALDLTHLRAAQDEEILRQLSTADRFRSARLQLVMVREGMAFIYDMFAITSSMVCLIIGGIFVSNGSMTLGALFSFYMASLVLRPYLRQCWVTIPQMLEGIESLNKLYGLLQVANLSPYTGRQKLPFTGKIMLDSVSFSYTDKTILQDVKLTIEPGRIIAIMGPNGAGKSTILHLILGFYRPQSGRLLADACPYDRLDMNHLRQSIGVVPQNPFIFSGTVYENITYGCPEVGETDVLRAARLATADTFIAQLPEGYDTLIGHNGLLLSGGQCQRLALARALLRHPRLLVLDEPTNHLDTAAIKQYMNHLKQLEDMPACLIITHNRDILDDVDSVYFLEAGRIIAKEEHRSTAMRA
ncbi:MAG: ABC transporter ATP-binding protein [Candidatus Competibacteraceae bacterium]